MSDFRYNLTPDGNILSCGYYPLVDGIRLTNEPFSGFDCTQYKKDMSNGEWIFLPDITPVNKVITNVRYDWSAEKVYITIADQYRPGPYEFDCTRTWTGADCQAAIEAKFNNNIQGG